MSTKIWLSSPHIGENEMVYIKHAFETNWIAPLGPHVDGFENDLQKYLGRGVHVAALSSGTAALHLALVMLGVSAGDVVLCQSLTFAASAFPIVYQGATPVFIDSEQDTWNMDPQLLEDAIIDLRRSGKNIRAIVAVHIYGMPANMDAILDVANRYGIPVVEDAAEALGSKYNGDKAGTFGAVSILSFNGNKIITTSGGGALVSNDPGLVQRSRFLATQARDNAPHYEHSVIGYNYRLSNVSASIGRGQMELIDQRVKQRRKNFHFYQKNLRVNEEVRFQPEPPSCFSNRWLTAVLFNTYETREAVRLHLASKNIESRPLWKPMHLQPVFSQHKHYTNGTSEKLFMEGLCLPSGSNLTEKDLQLVVETIGEAL